MKRMKKTIKDMKKQYIDDLKIYVEKTTYMNLMINIMEEVDENNEIKMLKPTKLKIAKKAKIDLTTINACLSVLVSRGLLTHKSTPNSKEALYALNPNIFGNKKWDKIKKINLNIEYNLIENKKNKNIQIEYKE